MEFTVSEYAVAIAYHHKESHDFLATQASIQKNLDSDTGSVQLIIISLNQQVELLLSNNASLNVEICGQFPTKYEKPIMSLVLTQEKLEQWNPPHKFDSLREKLSEKDECIKVSLQEYLFNHDLEEPAKETNLFDNTDFYKDEL